jgi:hypothetical protein
MMMIPFVLKINMSPAFLGNPMSLSAQHGAEPVSVTYAGFGTKSYKESTKELKWEEAYDDTKSSFLSHKFHSKHQSASINFFL